MSVNKVILVGRLGKDPVLRGADPEKPFATFTIATDYGYGEKRETEWTNCIVFGKGATYMCDKGQKGSTVLVEGRLRTRTYEDKEGISRKSTEVVVDNSSVIDGRKVAAVVEEDDEPVRF